MHLQRALTLPYDDPRWMAKLLPLVPLTFLMLLPIFGLIPLAIILGWVVIVVANIRTGVPRPLPDWRDLSRLITLGAEVLLVIILVHLPLLVIFLIAGLLGASIGATFYSLLYNVAQLCCLIPLSLMYMFVMWVLIGLGVLDYSESHKRRDLYRFRYQWDRARTHASLISGWLMRLIMVNVGCTLLCVIPLVGWILAPVILWPMQGILLGEMGRLMDGRQPIKKER